MNNQTRSGGWTPERSAAGNRNPWLVAGVVSIATFMVVLDTAIANVSLRYIAGSLAASVDESTWVVTTYLIANAVVLAGVNLPVLVKLASVRGTLPLLDAVKEAEAAGRKYIQLVSETLAGDMKSA